MDKLIISLAVFVLVVVGVGFAVVSITPQVPVTSIIDTRVTIEQPVEPVGTRPVAPRPEVRAPQQVLAPTVATSTKATSSATGASSSIATTSKTSSGSRIYIVTSATTSTTSQLTNLAPVRTNTSSSAQTTVSTTQYTSPTQTSTTVPPPSSASSQTSAGTPPATQPSAPSTSSSFWHPAVSTRFQLQFNGVLDMSIDSDAYDVDLFDTPKETIAALHARGKKVVCYVSAGSWEDWRPDSNSFPTAIIGKDYEGWPGENWLNIARIDILGPIMGARLDLAKSKGCDGIDPDNVDVYAVDSGFTLSYAQQITYNKWFATETHKRGMAIGLKNNLDQLSDLLSSFDFSILESCHEQGWCDQGKPFIAAGKPVFQIEYTEANAKLADICPSAKQRGFVAFIKHRNLDAFIQRCP